MAAPPVANHFNKTRPSQLLVTAMKTFICCKSTRIGLSQWIEFSSDGPISAIRWLVNGPIRSKSCAINSRQQTRWRQQQPTSKNGNNSSDFGPQTRRFFQSRGQNDGRSQRHLTAGIRRWRLLLCVSSLLLLKTDARREMNEVVSSIQWS